MELGNFPKDGRKDLVVGANDDDGSDLDGLPKWAAVMPKQIPGQRSNDGNRSNGEAAADMEGSGDEFAETSAIVPDFAADGVDAGTHAIVGEEDHHAEHAVGKIIEGGVSLGEMMKKEDADEEADSLDEDFA